MSTKQETSPKVSQSGKPSLVQKFGIPYYATTFMIVFSMWVFSKYNSPGMLVGLGFSVPILGKLMPKDDYPVLHSKEHNKNIWHVGPLVSAVLASWGAIVWFSFNYPCEDYTWWQTTLMALGLSTVVGPTIDASHQLLHRPEKIFGFLGQANMAVTLFTAYPIQHLYLHHKTVGTADDPITSPKNQNFTSYMIKAFFGAYKFVYNYSKVEFVRCIVLNLAYLGVIFMMSWIQEASMTKGLLRVGFFLAVAYFNFSMFEGIEYIEHYGLVFDKTMDKREIQERSSWNSELNQLHNWLIFRFQRHADHHMNAYKFYTTLELTEKMPRFPFDFEDGIIMSNFPTLWYYVMNPYVEQVMEGKKVSDSHKKITKAVVVSINLLVLGLTAWTFM